MEEQLQDIVDAMAEVDDEIEQRMQMSEEELIAWHQARTIFDYTTEFDTARIRKYLYRDDRNRKGKNNYESETSSD